MANLLWPGDHRADGLFTDEHVVETMIRIEKQWLALLVRTGIAPGSVTPMPEPPSADHAGIAVEAENSGNPVIPLVDLLRANADEPTRTWIHRGLTSQDVLDSALAVCTAGSIAAVAHELLAQVAILRDRIEDHRRTAMAARTLTQPAIPTTFALRLAGWLTGLLDAEEALQQARGRLPIQIGGAAGSLAAIVELARGRGLPDAELVAMGMVDSMADTFGLATSVPWHTSRSPFARVGGALAECCGAWGRIARDVLVATRAEISELSESPEAGRGGSSTLPGKHNPVLAVLLQRTALSAPGLAAALYSALGAATEERSDGAWHVEWETLRTLVRRTVVAARQATELLRGLTIDAAAMARNLMAAGGIHREQAAMAALTGSAAGADYTGATTQIIARALARADAVVARYRTQSGDPRPSEGP